MAVDISTINGGAYFFIKLMAFVFHPESCQRSFLQSSFLVNVITSSNNILLIPCFLKCLVT